MGPIMKQVDALHAKFAALQKQLAGVDAANNQIMRSMRHGDQNTAPLRDLVAQQGDFRTGSIRAASAAENFTTALQKQDVTMKAAIKQRGLFNEVLREQYRLQKMAVLEWATSGPNARISADAFVPKAAPAQLDSLGKMARGAADGTISLGQAADMARLRVGLMSEIVRSAGLNMVNLGKNTQWAGRQMMVGISIPLIAFGAASAALAYQVDEQLTRIARVYDSNFKDIEGTNRTVNEAIRKESMRTAEVAAREFGMVANETLEVTADLAATGQTGIELQKATIEVAKASLLGELDRQDAIKTTITLQNVFGKSAKEVGEAFRFMNQMENETSLSMRDMTVAIPRLGGVIKQLGGDIEDIGILMAAASSAGIPAEQAANALKSISFRNVAPTNKAMETFEQFTHVSLQGLIDKTNGEVIPTIFALNNAMKDLDRPTRVKVVRELQGLWQGSKFMSIADQFGLGEAADMSENVRRAFDVASQGAVKWGEVYDRELRTRQESASGTFKALFASLKTEMAIAGEPFLEIVNWVLKQLTKLVTAFNGMDEGTKKFLMIGAIATAIVGPVVMISGVFLNLLGTIVKFSGSLGMFLTRFKAVDVSQRTTALLAKATSGAFLSEADSLRALNVQLGILTGNLDAVATRQGRAAGMLAPALAGPKSIAERNERIAQTGEKGHGQAIGGVFQSAKGQPRYAEEGWKGSYRASTEQLKNSIALAHSQAKVENRVIATKNAFEGASKKVGQMNGGLLSTVGIMGLMVGGTNKWLMYISLILTTLPLLFPLFGKLIGMAGVFAAKMAATSRGGGAIAKVGTGMSRLVASAGHIGIAITVAAAAWGIFTWRQREAEKKMKNIANAGDDMAKAMGIIALKPGEWKDDAGEIHKTYVAMAKDFENTNKDAVNRMKDLWKEASGGDLQADAELRKSAMEIGLDVYAATQDADKAHQAVQSALYAAGAVEIAADVVTNFNANDFVARIKAEMTSAISNRALEISWHGNLGDRELKAQATEAAERHAETYQLVMSGTIKPEVMVKEWTSAAKIMTDQIDAIIRANMGNWNRYELDLFEEAKVDPNSIESIRQAFIVNEEFRNGIMAGTTPALAAMRESLGGTIDAYRFYSIQVAKATNLDKNAAVNGYDLGGMAKWAANHVETLANKTAKAGGAAGDAEGDLDGMNDALDATAEKAIDAATSMDRIQSAAKQAMENTWSAIMESAADQLEQQQETEMDAIKARSEENIKAIEADEEVSEAAFDARQEKEDQRHEDRVKAFEGRWDTAVESAKKNQERRKELEEQAFDDRIERIQDAIEAEQDAEKQRQAIFEAEKRRIQRLAELYTNNINFNAALTSGDLDEAARIGVNNIATMEQWNLDDASAGQGTASEARVKAMQEQIDLIEEEKTARMKALDEISTAEDKALEDRKERSREELDDLKTTNDKKLESDRDTARKGFEARRDAENKATEVAERAAQRQHEATKRSLDMSLAALQVATPRNEEEIKAHIARLVTTYDDHGITINTKSKEWAAMLNEAITTSAATSKASLQNDIDWALFGKKAAEDFIMGAFGKTVPEFQKMFGAGATGLAGGKPAPGKPNSSNPVSPRAAEGAGGRTQPVAGTGGRVGGITRHAGGRVNMGAGDRTGYPRSAAKFQSEVDTRLQVGEYVVKKKAVQKLGLPFMDAVNQGYLPGQPEVHHAGGAVGMSGVAGAALSGILQVAMAAGIRKIAEQGNPYAAAAEYRGRPEFAPAPIANFEGMGPYVPGPGLIPPDGFVPWMSAVQRGVRPDILAKVGSVLAQFPGGQRITSGYRPGSRVAGSGNVSLHALGRAVDIGMNAYNPQESAMGDAMAHMFRTQVPGVQEVLWKTMVGGNHFDHVHVGFRHQGGPIESSMTKGLRNGGITLNDGYAKLHAREAVLTAPLSSQLERGIGNLDRGVGNRYTVEMDLRGAVIDKDFDLEGAVARGIDKANMKQASKMGRKRKIGER